MISICEECGQKHRLSPEIIQGPSAAFKCKSCNHVITVRKSGFEDSYGPSRSPAKDRGLEFSGKKISVDSIKAGKPVIEGLSIRWKITGVIFLLVFCSLSAVGIIASIMSRDSLSKQAEDHLRMMSDQKSIEYKMIFDRLQEDTLGAADYLKKLYEKQIIATDTGIPILMPWDAEKKQFGNDEMKKRLQDEILIFKQFSAYIESSALKNPHVDLFYAGSETDIAAFHKRGTVDVFIKNSPGWMPTKRPWYKTAKEAGKLAWTDIYPDARTNQLCTTCVVPVTLENGKLQAVVAIDVLLDTLRNDILKLDIGYNSYAFLVNAEGKALVKPGMERGGLKWSETYKADILTKTDNPAFNAIIEKMIKGNSGLESYAEGNDEKYLSYTFLPIMNAGLGIVASKTEVIKPAVNLAKLIIYVWIGVLVIAIFVGLFLGGNITKPINKLTTAADLISQGKVDLEVLEEDRKDEIGVLTKAFNRLVISLKYALSR
jgi:HAMP domain-containing protein